MRYFVSILLTLFIAVLSVLPSNSRAAETIRIAAYDFPPYFSAYDTEHLVGDLIEALNGAQSDYQFELHDVPSKARFKALSDAGCCHLMLFESPTWGWAEQMPHLEVGDPMVLGAERLVAVKKRDQRGAEFFQREGLRFGGLIGYHYPFLGNRTDAGILEERFNVYLSLSHEVNMKMLLNGRFDVVMIHDEYLLQHRQQPWFDRLLLNPQAYGEYELRTLINPEKGFALADWRRIVVPLIENGTLARLLSKYKLPWPPKRTQLVTN
ncbi:hypothetical protein [Pseudidiomarina homiensis]|uniref:hypothetical protein n=1 Tax=Pseudidiomarina homiensis TaxID=364198 RepID=UPI000F86CF12|nr:hypothetical protein [Pseudidiomarina homiensis]